MFLGGAPDFKIKAIKRGTQNETSSPFFMVLGLCLFFSSATFAEFPQVTQGNFIYGNGIGQPGLQHARAPVN